MSLPLRSRVLLDCSSTRTCDFNSGIQRTVRSLCAHADGIRSLAVYGDADSHYYQAKSLWPTNDRTSWSHQLVKGRIGRCYRSAIGPACEVFPLNKLRKLILPSKGHCGIFKLPKLAIDQVQQVYVSMRSPAARIDINPNDILLLADASWQTPNWECIARARACGATVGNLIYDLIPLTHPEFFPQELVERFNNWFRQSIRSNDFFICISEHVAEQVREQLEKIGVDKSTANRICMSFRLGADLRSPSSAAISSPITQLFSVPVASRPHVVIGTVEPRKNHALVLDAFDSLWGSGVDERLCIIGRIGWNCDAIVNRIVSHPQFGKKLFMFNHANDADVNYVYRQAKSLVTASHNEGFGLPIVEALDVGQVVLASDIPVHREVGGEQVEYFSINAGCSELASRVLSLSRSRPACRLRTSSRILSWAESYQELMASVKELAQQSTIPIRIAA